MSSKYSNFIISLVWIAAVIMSCGKETALIDPPFNGGENASVRLSGLGECENQQSTTLAATERNDELQAVVQDGKVSFTHSRALYNCCLDSVSLDIEADGDMIRVVESEHCGEPCFCTCEYAVSGEILDLEPGSYTIQIFDETNAEEVLCYVGVEIN